MYIYTVQPGDTLPLIAQRFRTTVELIIAANIIEDPQALPAGQLLRIPVLGPIRVRVQPGESLWLISQRYDVPVEVLAAANEIDPPFTIFPGQVLVIPIITPDAPGCIAWLSTRTGRPDIFTRSPRRQQARQITRLLGLESTIPKWSPDGRYIAFVGRGNALWVVNVETLNAERIIENLPIFEDFDWSPNSTTIAFSRNDTQAPQIITIEVETGQTAFVTQGTEVTYFPDGRRLLFESNRTGQSQLYIINVDGTGLRQVTNITEEGEIQSVDLSPDGTRAAFNFSGPNIIDVRIVNIATGEVLNTPPGDLNQDFNPVWSPDGRYLAYNSSLDEGPAGLRGRIRVVSPQGELLRDLTDSACFGGRLAWSPNSTNIAYNSCVTPEAQLAVVGFVGLPIQITSLGINENPDWSMVEC